MRSDVGLVALVAFTVVFVSALLIRGRKNRRLALLTAAGAICLGMFALFNLLDWPSTVLTPFWTQHAIVAATASTLPLAGVGFFAFKLYDTSVQEELDQKVAATARSGLVDHLVDVDVALTLLSWRAPEIWRRWPESKYPDRPLRWLRFDRDRLGSDGRDGIKASDPRSKRIDLHGQLNQTQSDLLDQAVRRLMAGIKEWGPLLAQSRSGESDLIALGEIRLRLLELRSAVAKSDAVDSLQQRCREMALEFERDTLTTDESLEACQRKELVKPEIPEPSKAPIALSHWTRLGRKLRAEWTRDPSRQAPTLGEGSMKSEDGVLPALAQPGFETP